MVYEKNGSLGSLVISSGLNLELPVYRSLWFIKKVWLIRQELLVDTSLWFLGEYC